MHTVVSGAAHTSTPELASAGAAVPDTADAVPPPVFGRSALLGPAFAAILSLARICHERAGAGPSAALESVQWRGRAAAGELPERAALPTAPAVLAVVGAADDGLPGRAASGLGRPGHVASDRALPASDPGAWHRGAGLSAQFDAGRSLRHVPDGGCGGLAALAGAGNGRLDQPGDAAAGSGTGCCPGDAAAGRPCAVDVLFAGAGGWLCHVAHGCGTAARHSHPGRRIASAGARGWDRSRATCAHCRVAARITARRRSR